MCLGTKWRRGHKWHNMVVKQGRRMTGVGYTDWHCTPCFVHLLPATPAVTCQPPSSPQAPAPPRHPWKRCIYISIYVHRLTHRVCTIPPSPIPVIKGANRFHGTRLRFSSTKRCSLADTSYPRIIKFIHLEIEKLEGSV